MDQQIQFQYANECDLEIHCSPFGLSGLYIKIKGTNIIGIGSTMGLITGSLKGLIHYNDSQDLIDQKYKLYVVVDEEGTLRIDFTKIFTLPSSDRKNLNDENSSETAKHDIDKYAQHSIDEDVPTLIFTGKCPEGRPDKVEPFIGIFSFEREE
ncbi:hypothetical protein HYPBUDRAFT_113500 [Hyphopichia burtonii NRRL Y-1933]|uniref:Uncharacterized protein n=1 Tax=Hyphopichia burtonii NRRL Y-1933 TaxID=984485 RepID=A0A1E4RET0_9ASCO|nr:hypothetical protein HYPBUDRAFT_113500 [Hyphopichia burtonii NRRL Y-1933]ODV65779.1 hypothetical protein HYPBUDRAFT_113500 [Hyphopichia burtonii NRRL Y-1933]